MGSYNQKENHHYRHILLNLVRNRKSLFMTTYVRLKSTRKNNGGEVEEKMAWERGGFALRNCFPICFKLNVIWSWWRFSFWLYKPRRIPFVVYNPKENCRCDHIPLNLKESKIDFSECVGFAQLWNGLLFFSIILTVMWLCFQFSVYHINRNVTLFSVFCLSY